MTIAELLKSSLRLIQVLGPGRAQNGSETTDALVVLNAMLRSWANNRLIVHATTRAEYSLDAASSYTIGPGGDIDADRPAAIAAAAELLNGEEIPIKLFTHGESPYKEGLYYSAGWPLGTLTPFPEWTEGKTLVLYTREVFAEIDDTSDDVEFPPGYEDAIRYNLAVRLAPEWGKVVQPIVTELARTSLAEIMSANLPMVELRLDSGIFPS